MNIPNMLTMSRFVLIPLFLAFYFNDHAVTALLIILLAGLTDLLDGYIARRSGQITLTGTMLDPLADKLMMLSVVVALLIGGEIPWSAAAIMAFREVGMIVSSTIFYFRGLRTVPANVYGKLTTFVYYVAIVFLFLDVPGGVGILWCAVALSFVTTGVYLMKFRRLNRAS
ncbi:CDP-alcohol phosphatidyltransferase family protein [Cohnella thailandensis]|uniref:CDP-diacylglycerol--glycerol-3-phosphate 3-phosphatidyltransferase n=1 Tax=Cohnella thailandensis TaxID=557557 RepID=A0A841TA78_9BACL|nr:CDP-alcohol phosphatidyltransferase family protein [Cohnella thailandensis]MBB6638121.1 CDP-alcohol phosphatidyltransferase family protein [Cohnella thailandensis]MBP1971952.1 cardiolipin synthase [Cohnella thailandensis]